MILTGERMILDRMKKETEIEHLCRYQYAKQFVADRKVLDAACGSGYGVRILAEKADYVIGVDISAEAVAFADKEYKQDNTEYAVASVEKLPFDDESFDVVVSFETIEHVDETVQKAFLSEIKRVLKEDGLLIMSTPNKKKFTDERGGRHSEYHVKEFYEDEFETFLRSMFEHVVFAQQFYAKAACIIDPQDCQAQMDGFMDEKGMYVVALASNTSIQKLVRDSFIMRYPEQYEQMNDYVQLFYSDTLDFSEDNSQISEIDNRDVLQQADICLDGVNCKYLRIDPIAGRGIIHIDKIQIVKEDGKREIIEKYTSNADKEENGDLFFYKGDPQIFVELPEQTAIYSVRIEFSLVNAKEGVSGDDAVIKTLMQENENLNAHKETILKDIERLTSENSVLQSRLQDIYDSKTWKIQRKIAQILGR